ncbi:calmodulin-binding transcription activator 2-like [Pistacia vera]|uniref:calmodulin-binding transcription activator 2-like n=1 Tax=Pistacia vera TaxID=55513 RepID=UPI00126358F6|nr:calmodulin-binding transcription activator 2-like [Pistacia vera]
MASRIRFSLNHLLHSSSLFIPSFKSNPFTLSKISKLSPSHSSFSTLNSTCQIKLEHLPGDSAEGLEELRKEAQHRWFNAAEIHDMFAKYERHDIVITERQERPPSGSFFAIKRHMMRDFKKDGHNWTKKKNGKTVQEANRILKVGNVKMLRCFYVHGQDNDNFQRRIYWMLDQ